MMKCLHNWNRNTIVSDGLYEGHPCDFCLAFITSDGSIVEREELDGPAAIISYAIMAVVIIGLALRELL
jgi:hypothetical protein